MTQKRRLLRLMQRGRTVTRMIAFNYGIMNLTARISELREDGHDVRCYWKYDDHGQRYGAFYLEAA